jgi:SAM-dependent methyltransferase
MSSQQSDLLQLFAGKFDYESTLSTGAPAPSYYWYRKRNRVAALIRDNIKLFPVARPDGSPCTLVDVGSGDGLDLFLIRDVLRPERPGYRYLGLDGSETGYKLSLLRKQYHDRDDIDFRRLDLSRGLPLDDHSADVLYCSEVLEHIPDPEGLLREFRRVLRPGGLFLMTTPNEPNCFQKAYWFGRARERARLQTEQVRANPQRVLDDAGRVIELHGHISCRTCRQWDRAAANCGFRLIDYQRGATVYGGHLFYVRSLVLATQFLAEFVLDLLPRGLTRTLSNQVIALYQRAQE